MAESKSRIGAPRASKKNGKVYHVVQLTEGRPRELRANAFDGDVKMLKPDGATGDVTPPRVSGQYFVVDGHVVKIEDKQGHGYSAIDARKILGIDFEQIAIVPPQDGIEIALIDKMHSFLKVARRKGERGNELADAILEESTDILDKLPASGSTMTADEARVLVESGAFTADELEETEKEVAAGAVEDTVAKTKIAALRETLNTDEVAEILGIDPSRVRHRQGAGLLYSFPVAGNRRRYPSWQFDPEQQEPIPGLKDVIAAIPKTMHHVSVQGFMTSPKDGLRFSDAPGEGKSSWVSPVNWLRQGGDPQSVVGLLRNRHIS